MDWCQVCRRCVDFLKQQSLFYFVRNRKWQWEIPLSIRWAFNWELIYECRMFHYRRVLYILIVNDNKIPVVPHNAVVAKVSKIANRKESLVVVNQGWQSEATDGLKGA